MPALRGVSACGTARGRASCCIISAQLVALRAVSPKPCPAQVPSRLALVWLALLRVAVGHSFWLAPLGWARSWLVALLCVVGAPIIPSLRLARGVAAISSLSLARFAHRLALFFLSRLSVPPYVRLLVARSVVGSPSAGAVVIRANAPRASAGVHACLGDVRQGLRKSGQARPLTDAQG